ncbi:hypothetical protein [Rhodococcus indonesiensis]|uniref:hypothetical protein n=1 Tax=Rhodococcus indonesiensis TaxID=3055869 RepID=UPI0039F6E40E
MGTWVVNATYELDEPAETVADRLEAALETHDASVSAGEGGRTDITAYIDACDPLKAFSVILDDVAAALPSGHIPLVVQVMTEDEWFRRADAPSLPELLSTPEVGELLGVTRQRVAQLRKSAAFPEPLFELRTGPIWAISAITNFAEKWARKPGRPATTTGA